MRYLILATLCSLVITNSSLNAQVKEIKKPIIPTSSHKILISNKQGIDFYRRKSDNHILNGQYDICETYLNTNTDIVNSYNLSGICKQGNIRKGFKNEIWKTTYKEKIVKTINYNNGLVTGKYRVYSTKGKALYKTNFGTQGNGKFKDYYYKTGILKQEGNYENGKKEGEWCDYDENGNIKTTVYYKNGTPIKK